MMIRTVDCIKMDRSMHVDVLRSYFSLFCVIVFRRLV